ncbi:MAG: hypothetical protein J0L93_05310 [Deltaproteobacteria bacterium]|nr:hypothetical protein [Deltaproteobacteria bacterium]
MHLLHASLFWVLLQSPLSAGLQTTEKIEAPVSAVYLPARANTLESVKFMVESDLSPLCYQLNDATVRVQFDRNVILVHLDATPTQPHCIQDETKSIQQVNLGMLPKGEYEVRNLKNLKKWGNIIVEKSTKIEIAMPEFQTAERAIR